MNWVATETGFDEIFEPGHAARPHYAPLVGILESFTKEDVERRERLQKLALMNHGITFTVYGEQEGLERIFPFDFVPRIIPASEWTHIQDGLVQRITALNLFLLDVYADQNCLEDGIVPPDLVFPRFDPTHNREVDERYVTVAHGRDYEDVPPNKGIYRGNARETLTAEVYTRPSTRKAVSALHEEVAQIDLPVFPENVGASRPGASAPKRPSSSKRSSDTLDRGRQRCESIGGASRRAWTSWGGSARRPGVG